MLHEGQGERHMQEKTECRLSIEDADLSCQIMQQDDLDPAIRCMVDAFTHYEPMTKALKITSDEFYQLAKIVCEKSVKDQLSLVAKEKKTGNVVAFSVAEDLMSEPPEGIENISDSFQPIFALLEDLDRVYKRVNRPVKGGFLRLFMGGSCFIYKNRGIITALLEGHLQLAREKNFLGVVAEVTGPISRHILVDKYSFKEKNQIEYKSYVYNGRKVFANIEDASACILIEKRF